ncbi:MAG: hypothetical protein AB8B92_00520 [Gammaproteobacteria bacterium]
MSSEDYLRTESLSKTVRIFLLLATIVIIGITIALMLNKQPTITQQSLEQDVASIQQQLPIRVDAFTQLNKVDVGEMEIKYLFLVHDDPAQPSGLNVEGKAFSKQVETSVKTNACRNKNTRRYINSDVSLSYRYLDKDKNTIAEFIIPAGFCN